MFNKLIPLTSFGKLYFVSVLGRHKILMLKFGSPGKKFESPCCNCCRCDKWQENVIYDNLTVIKTGFSCVELQYQGGTAVV